MAGLEKFVEKEVTELHSTQPGPELPKPVFILSQGQSVSETPRRMSEAADSRDAENNWVIASTEGLPVETVGAAQTSAHQIQLETPPADSDRGHGDAGSDPIPPITDIKECEPSSLPADPPTLQQHVEFPHEEPQDLEPGSAFGRVERCVLTLAQYIPDALRSWRPRSASRTGEDLEEVSCSSSDDDVEGLRKRVPRGSAPVSVGPITKEAAREEEDGGSGLSLNKCIIAALALVGLGCLVFSGGFGSEEDPAQTLKTRSVRGRANQPQIIADIQDWMDKHSSQFSGDPGSLNVMNQLLDRVAQENQDIRHMQATLQAQKEELQSMLKISEGERVSPGPQHLGLSEENIRLKDTLLKEETAHLGAQEELQSLRDKLETLEGSSLEQQGLGEENTKLKGDLDSAQRQIQGFLTQKETLVAEAQMLRQELDKQRTLVGSIRRDLEGLTTQKSSPEMAADELQGKISDMSGRLALEVQRSETWEKRYVEHAQRRKEQVGEHSHKEWKKGEKLSRTHNISTARDIELEKHGKDHGMRVKESQHEEGKSRKHQGKKEQPWHHKKHQEHQENRPPGMEDVREWEKNRGEVGRHHHPEDWKDKQSKHHHGEVEGEFHPRKGQKDFNNARKEEKRKESERNLPGKEPQHRHHDHNKFWKKLSNHQYRVPEGCSGVEDCARKDGLSLFNMELKPVQRKQFEDVLQSYLAKTDFSKHLPQLVPLLDGFFEGPVFSHDKIRFRDFVDDVEDFLEDLARRETGDDDAVDDFERYVYVSFFGEAATNKKKFRNKDANKKTEEERRRGTGPRGLHPHHDTENPVTTSHHVPKQFREVADPSSNKEHNPGDQHRSPKQPYQAELSGNHQDHHPINHKHMEDGHQDYKHSHKTRPQPDNHRHKESKAQHKEDGHQDYKHSHKTRPQPDNHRHKESKAQHKEDGHQDYKHSHKTRPQPDNHRHKESKAQHKEDGHQDYKHSHKTRPQPDNHRHKESKAQHKEDRHQDYKHSHKTRPQPDNHRHKESKAQHKEDGHQDYKHSHKTRPQPDNHRHKESKAQHKEDGHQDYKHSHKTRPQPDNHRHKESKAQHKEDGHQDYKHSHKTRPQPDNHRHKESKAQHKEDGHQDYKHSHKTRPQPDNHRHKDEPNHHHGHVKVEWNHHPYEKIEENKHTNHWENNQVEGQRVPQTKLHPEEEGYVSYKREARGKEVRGYRERYESSQTPDTGKHTSYKDHEPYKPQQDKHYEMHHQSYYKQWKDASHNQRSNDLPYFKDRGHRHQPKTPANWQEENPHQHSIKEDHQLREADQKARKQW
ncbi:pre-B-cell leukemia transcription factor-interacting protein 1 [Pelodytes ibericus]